MESVRVDELWLNAGARPVVDVFPDERRSDDGREVVGQKTDPDTGLPRWRVEFPFKGEGDRRAVMAMVTVISATEPDVVGRVPVFGGVWARKWHMDRQGGASSGLAFSAESFSTADAKPSTKRAAKAEVPSGPPPPNGAGTPATAGKR